MFLQHQFKRCLSKHRTLPWLPLLGCWGVTSRDPGVRSCMHKKLFLKPNQVEQINMDAREQESMEEKNGGKLISREVKLTSVGRCLPLHTGSSLPAAPTPSCFPGIGALFGTAVPQLCKQSSAAPAPVQSQGPAVLLGLSLRRGYEHINHSSKKKRK